MRVLVAEDDSDIVGDVEMVDEVLENVVLDNEVDVTAVVEEMLLPRLLVLLLDVVAPPGILVRVALVGDGAEDVV